LKSSSDDTHFAKFVERAFAALLVEVSWAYAMLVGRLGNVVLDIAVDGERARVSLGPDGAHLQVSAVGAAGDVRCSVSRTTILDLVAGRTTLLDAILADAVVITGPAEILAVASDAAHLFLHGAVRSPSCAKLFFEFRASTTNEGVSTHAAPD
jgi:hypothetical protein